MDPALKIYRSLLKLFPARFREEYSRQLEQQFVDERREARWAMGSRLAVVIDSQGFRRFPAFRIFARIG